ncbi:MAG: hypothetical protein GY950_31865, partial [bacterium]|nr:hypothetical protein [bacterium]
DGKKKKRKPRYTFDRKLHIIRTALENALKPGDFQDYIAEFGYAPPRLDSGIELLNKTELARTHQKNAIANKVQKTREARTKKAAAEDQYKHFFVIGREEFKDNPHILDILGFNGVRKRTFGDWKEQTRLLFDNISFPGVLDGYAKHSITEEILKAGKQAVTEAETAIADRNEAKAEAEKATEHKEKIFEDLMDYWQKFVKVVDVALEEEPQLKEQVNIVTPSLY